MRLSDVRPHRPQTKLFYSSHRLPHWLNEKVGVSLRSRNDQWLGGLRGVITRSTVIGARVSRLIFAALFICAGLTLLLNVSP
jgi:hypothetical protein